MCHPSYQSHRLPEWDSGRRQRLPRWPQVYTGREWYTACPTLNVTLFTSTPNSWSLGGMTPDCRMQGTLPHHGNIRASQHGPDVTLFCKDACQAKPLTLIIAISRVLPGSYPPFSRATTSFSHVPIDVSTESLQGTYTIASYCGDRGLR